MDDTILLNKYIEKKDDFFRLTTNSQYIFELTKCCGYGEWITVHKDAPLSRLYENINRQFGSLKALSLYAVDVNGAKLEIPCDWDCSVRKLITAHSAFFRPIYPLPAYTIYRIYYDQECCCTKECIENKQIHKNIDT